MYNLEELLNDFVIPASQPIATSTNAIAASTSTQATNAITRALAGNEYASDYLQTDLEQLGGRVLLAASTGSGKNNALTARARAGTKITCVLHTQAAVQQQAAIARRGGLNVAVYYQHEKTQNIHDAQLILTTPDSVASIVSVINTAQYELWVDEWHQLAYAAYRAAAWNTVAQLAGRNCWARVVCMTGTPTSTPPDTSAIRYNKQRQQPYSVLKSENRLKDTLAILATLERSERAIVYLNNKSEKLAYLTAGLDTMGITWLAANSDNREAVTQLATAGVPDGVQVLIGTAIIEESISVNEQIRYIINCESMTDHQHQQLAARARAGAAKYIMFESNSTESVQYKPFEYWLKSHARMASQQLAWANERLKALGDNTGNIRTITTTCPYIIYDADSHELSENTAAIHNAAAGDYAYSLRNNPEQLAANLAAYGWQLVDAPVIVAPNAGAVAAGAVAAELAHAHKQAEHANACELLLEMGEIAANAAQKELPHTAREILERVRSAIENETVTYARALELYASTQGSKAEIKKVTQRLRMLETLRTSKELLATAAKIELGTTITAGQYHAILAQQLGRVPTTAKRIGSILGATFELERLKIRDGTKTVWAYKIIGYALPETGELLAKNVPFQIFN